MDQAESLVGCRVRAASLTGHPDSVYVTSGQGGAAGEEMSVWLGGRGRPQEGGFARSVRAWHGSTSRLRWWLRKSMREWTFVGLYVKMLPVEADEDHPVPPAPPGNLPPQHPPRQCRARGGPAAIPPVPPAARTLVAVSPRVLMFAQNARKAALSVADRALPAWGTR